MPRWLALQTNTVSEKESARVEIPDFQILATVMGTWTACEVMVMITIMKKMILV